MVIKRLFYILVLMTPIHCYSQSLEHFIEIGTLEPRNIDARYYYDERNYTDDEAYAYIEKYDRYFQRLIPVEDRNVIKKFEGKWCLSVQETNGLYEYSDFKSGYNEIQFGYNSFIDGYQFQYWGSLGSGPAYMNDDYIVSTIHSMGWIAPIIRYELIDEKMYLYILDHDEWRLADFHQDGLVYYTKVSEEYNPSYP